MNLIELNRALRQLRLGGIAAVLETRLQQAQTEPMAPIDFQHPSVANYEKLLAAKPERALQADSDRQSSSTSSLCLAHYRHALT